MEYKIPEDLMQALAQYLASKPYAEVFQLIDALKGIAQQAQIEEQQKQADQDNVSGE